MLCACIICESACYGASTFCNKLMDSVMNENDPIDRIYLVDNCGVELTIYIFYIACFALLVSDQMQLYILMLILIVGRCVFFLHTHTHTIALIHKR